MSLKPQTPDWKTVHRKFSKPVSQTHFESKAKLTKANTCAIILIRQDQGPRLPPRWKCAHRLTPSGGSGTVRIRERRGRDIRSVKAFESIAGWFDCSRAGCADKGLKIRKTPRFTVKSRCLAPQTRLELATFRLGGGPSIQLRYWGIDMQLTL